MNSVFNYNQNQVRTTLINNQPYFCLVDCCKVLHIRNSKTTAQLNKDGVGKTYLTDNLGRKQEATFINEPNLYRLIFRSNKPEAQKFANWVYEEVLPQIRKTGEYKSDFTTTLTTVKQHIRKLPKTRVRKEIVLSETGYEELLKRIENRFNANKILSTLGGVVKNCVKFEMDKYLQIMMQPELNLQTQSSKDTDLTAFDKKELFDDKKRNEVLKQAKNKLLSMIDEFCNFQSQIAEITGAVKYNIYLKKNHKRAK